VGRFLAGKARERKNNQTKRGCTSRRKRRTNKRTEFHKREKMQKFDSENQFMEEFNQENSTEKNESVTDYESRKN
jgi:hypothetical protein